MRGGLEKLGSVGAVIAAAACPVCFPKLALIGALFGLGALEAYELQLFIAAQALVVIALAGHALAYLRHRKNWLLGLAIASGAGVFGGIYLVGSEALAYAGFAGLIAASGADFWARIGKEGAVQARESEITCPNCGHRRREIMPDNACQFFYECQGCHALLRPKPGDCCVFCSFGSLKCPPAQLAAGS